jgi:hypothetical protein
VGCPAPLGFSPDYFPFIRLPRSSIFASIHERRHEFVITN